MLNIFYGRENLDKEKFIYDNIGGRALLVVPDQFTLEAERELIAHSGAKALMDVEVLSLSRLGYRLLEELGGSKRTFIDKYGRHMILSSIAAEEREKLQVFKGLEEKKSFIELVNNFISEMKQFNCGADELAEIARSVPEGRIRRGNWKICICFTANMRRQSAENTRIRRTTSISFSAKSAALSLLREITSGFTGLTVLRRKHFRSSVN